MQLLPGLYQISGTVSGLSGSQAGDVFDECNVYCIKTEAGLILIDGGSGDYWRRWRPTSPSGVLRVVPS